MFLFVLVFFVGNFLSGYVNLRNVFLSTNKTARFVSLIGVVFGILGSAASISIMAQNL